jgi:channel protein (hemolysin III family)
VHAIGVCLGLVGAVIIVVMSIEMERICVAPVLVYVIGLVTMLVLSAAYNMWPVSPAKWVLRRFDHSAIYLLIAGTYTPFLMLIKNVLLAASLGIGVWSTAVVGMALKLALPGRFDRLRLDRCALFALLKSWSLRSTRGGSQAGEQCLSLRCFLKRLAKSTSGSGELSW